MVSQAMIALGAANALLRALGFYSPVINAVSQVKQQLACEKNPHLMKFGPS